MTQAEEIAAEQVAYWRAQGVLAKEAMAVLRPRRSVLKAGWPMIQTIVAREWERMSP
jgi:hypothetical protein